jgi:hypothetical protein
MAACAVELFEDADLLAKAKAEFTEAAKAGYTCPIPKDEYAKAIEM